MATLRRTSMIEEKKLKIEKLDFDTLYDEAEKAGRIGMCSNCGEEHVLCWCGICFKYCHDDYFHESFNEEEI